MATRKVGGIVAELLLNDKDFRQKLNRAGKLTESRAAQMRKTFNRVGGAMLAGAGVAGGALAAGIARANVRVDQLAKTADKLGIAPERLQAMRQAAELSGVATNTLDMAMQRMVRRVAEAAQGTGEAVKALKELGVSATELNRMSPDKQMGALADAMAEVENQSDRVRLAMKLFDSEGVALVNMLQMGSDGFDEISDELERFGIAITRIDAAKVEAANDEFTRLRTIQSGFWDQLSIKAAVPLRMIGNMLLDRIDEFGGMDEAADTVMTNLVNGAGHVGDVFWGWSVGITAAQEGVMRLASMVARLAREFGVFEKLAEFEHGLSVAGHEQGLRAAAIQELLREEAITAHPRWDVREGHVQQRLNPADERLIDERIDQLRNELHGVVPDAPEPRVSDDFLSDLEANLTEGAEELATRLQDRIDAGKPSTRLQTLLDDETKKWSKDWEKRREAINAEADVTTDSFDVLSESAEAAAEELEKLSVQDIADLDPTGSRGGLAQRILDLEEQAKREEAQGRDSAAARTRERAQELRDRLETLQQGGSQVQGDQGFQRRRDEMRERNFVGPPEGEVSPESEAAPEVRSGNQVDTGGSGSENEASILREILSAINNLPQLIGVV